MSTHGNQDGPTLYKIISGGQTGADIGGLLAAFDMKVETGGTAPAGFMTAAGANPLLEVLGLKAKGELKNRTLDNIRDSDGTLIFTQRFDSPGSVLTRRFCRENNKPFMDIDLNPLIDHMSSMGLMNEPTMAYIRQTEESIETFISQHRIGVLNIAGNREKKDSMYITNATRRLLHTALNIMDLHGLIIRAM